MTRIGLCAVAAIVAIGALLRAQQPIAPVDFRPFSDGRHWIVKEPLTYIVGESKESVTVPVGFVTDLASIPPVFHSIIQQNGRYILPAVVHDYLYWKQTCTRAQSDGIFLLAMIEQKVSAAHRTAIYRAVQAAGGFAWDANTKERATGVLRIIPATHFKIPANIGWSEYQLQLRTNAIASGPDTEITQSFCARGTMPIDRALRP